MAALKIEGGQKYSSKAFAYVPDVAKASTWKLRLWSDPSGEVTARQVGAAIAAIGPRGYHGKKASIPSSAMGSVKQKIRAAYKSLYPGRALPTVLKKSFDAIEKSVERLAKSGMESTPCLSCSLLTLPDDSLCRWCGSPLETSIGELMKEKVKKTKGGIEETDRSFRVQVADPKGFIKSTLRSVSMTKGVTGLFGKTQLGGSVLLRTLVFSKSLFPTSRDISDWLKTNKIQKKDSGFEQPTFPLWLEDDKEFILMKSLIDADQVGEYSSMYINREDGISISLEHDGSAWHVSHISFNRKPYPTMEQAENWINETRETIQASKDKWDASEVLPLDGGPQKFIIHASFDDLTQRESTLPYVLLKEEKTPVFDIRFGSSSKPSAFFGWRTDSDPIEATPVLKRVEGPAFWLETDTASLQPKILKTRGAYAPVAKYRETFVIDYGTWRLKHATPTSMSFTIESDLKKEYGNIEMAWDDDLGWMWLTDAAESIPGDRVEWAKKQLQWVIVPDGAQHAKIDVDAAATKIPQYSIVKSTGDQKYTLGVAYPVSELDAHKDYMTKEKLEQAAWLYMVKCQDVGLYHKDGTSGSGRVVESYIYRGPNWTIKGADGAKQVIKAGDWLLGVMWNDEAWEVVKTGKIRGYSFQGLAKRVIRELSQEAAIAA